MIGGRGLALSALVVLGAVAPGALRAQEPHIDAIWVRAVGGVPPPAVVARVASDAEPHIFFRDSRPDLERATAERVAKERCGSLQPGYAAAFEALNPSVRFEPDRIVGTQLYDVRWPACLWARPTEYLVRAGENYSTILQRLSGQGITAPRPLSAGEVLKLVATEPTELRMRHDRIEAFLRFLDDQTRTVAQRDVRLAVSSDPPKIGGEIFAPVGAGVTAGAGQDCTPSGAAFDAGAVLATYDWAARARPRSRVEMVIVDNGFFGFTCDASGCPPLVKPHSSVFPAGFFHRDHARYRQYHDVGPPDTAGNPPSNYVLDELPLWTRIDPQYVDDISGHGTHVAGLAIGGPAMLQAERRTALYGDSPWARLLILSVGRGSRSITENAATKLWDHLRRVSDRPIVNMSFVLTVPDGHELRSVMSRGVQGEPKMLFVVAAGNGGPDEIGDPTEETNPTPSGLGGARSVSNVVTVAALDGDGRLARFSNYGESVDLAAPGCKIASWVGGTPTERPLSGTSQAAPIVTFAASLMRSIWDTEPLNVKQRLIFAGDYLPCAEFDGLPGKRCVSGRSRLNIPKALLIRNDVVTFRDPEAGGQRRQLFGKLTASELPRPGDCAGRPRRSLKRTGATGFALYSAASEEALRVCEGDIAVADQAQTITIEAVGELLEGGPAPDDGSLREFESPVERTIALSEIDDIVFASETE